MKRLFKTPIIALFMLAAACASAAPIVATPGSMAGYTYFPKAQAATGGSGSSGTDNVGTLQRCFWTPPAGDHTVTLSNSNWYDYGDTRPITFYYKIAGGNGGANYSGGGGGSSAILKNGTELKVAPGGNGGSSNLSNQISPAQEGSFTATKADVLRFVTGGGGGDGAIYGGNGYYYSFVGGGGGAGYMGGGGGASASVGAMSPADAEVKLINMGGKGGGTTTGAGGVPFSGTQYGTAGSGMNGGVATYPDGNSAPVGTTPIGLQNYTYYCDVSGPCYGQYRFPAKPGINGSHAMPLFYSSGSMIGIAAGGGGALGYSGTGITYITYDSYRSGMMSTSPGTPSSNGNYSTMTTYGTSLMYYSVPTTLNLTRAPRTEAGGSTGGGLSGQIVLMYQAPVCSILK
ncbi:hypothetical protein LJR189_004658 [Acidovorax delafieldii]|uniref:hypothetical protein n=1 Tax=Acidovorax delafieldii TaxID=47920 RepID=UPI003ECFC49B